MKTFLIILAIVAIYGTGHFLFPSEKTVTVSLALDQEKMLDANTALNSGTQSVNRYHSNLQKFSEATFRLLPSGKQLEIQLSGPGGEKVSFHGIETQHLVPLLPYEHGGQIDDFDKANLLLAEFARNGIDLSYQEENSTYGYFNATGEVFNEEGEYRYVGNKIEPNPGVRPVRMSVVNNCLHPGLWEVSASDAVGEMFHAWTELPQNFYFEMVKSQNGISTPVAELQAFFAADQLENIPLDLGRLRQQGKKLLEAEARVATGKQLGGYSSQDSRRKVQRKFYRIFKDGEPDTTATDFGKLTDGHVFKLHSFIPPGIYDHTQPFEIAYHPHWKKVEIHEVTPKTSYGYPANATQDPGSIEITLHSTDGQQAFVAGNIPVSLLVFSEDYSIPAFGTGVLSASELVERRYLRLREGPLPHYAYLAHFENGKMMLANNHKAGYEQLYLRPFLQGEEMFLRFTVVSYERIVDLMEFEIPVTGELKDRILRASERYQPPVYLEYTDDNLL